MHKLFLILLSFILLISFQSNSAEKQASSQKTNPIKLSLAQWSLHRTFMGASKMDWKNFNNMLHESPDSIWKGSINVIDFPTVAAKYGFECIELVNYFYFNKAKDSEFWQHFSKKCDEAGVTVGLIMCDRIGDLGDANEDARILAVKNHHEWIDVAKALGAHSIRVNAAGTGTPVEVAAQVSKSLRELGQYAQLHGVNVIVENHGGNSSNAEWLAGVIENVGLNNVGTLPDFGNFCLERDSQWNCLKEYDKYKGTKELLPYAKGISAKSYDFDESGNETTIDYYQMMNIIKNSGYKGYIGVEYEGTRLSEDEGIKATKALLTKAINDVFSMEN